MPKNDNLGELKDHASALDSIKEENIYLHMKDGAILELYKESTQSPLFNINSGIASLFQLQHQHSEVAEVNLLTLI